MSNDVTPEVGFDPERPDPTERALPTVPRVADDRGPTTHRPASGGRHLAAPPSAGPDPLATAREWGARIQDRARDGFTARTPFIVAIVTFLGLYLTRRLYRSGMAQGDDAPYHVARNSFALHDLFLHGHLDGWSPIFNGGSQQFLIYGPGLAMISAAFRLLTLGMVSEATLLSIIAALALTATAPAMYLLARALRLTPIGAGVAAALSLVVSVPFGVGAAGTFGNGLVPHQVSVPFFLLVLAGIVHLVEGPSRRWTLVTAFGSAAIMVIHSLSLPVLAPAVAVLLALGFVRVRLTVGAVVRLGAAGLAGLGVSAFWWVPLMENPGPRPPLATWGTAPFPTRLKDMFTGSDWAHPAVAALACFALAIVVIRLVATARTEPLLGRWGWSIALTGPVLLGVVQLMHYRMHGDLGVSMATRGLGYAGLLCLLPVGALADMVANTPAVPSRSRRFVVRPRHAALFGLACVPALMGYLPSADRLAKATPPSPALVAAAKTLDRVMAKPDVFVWVNESGFDQSFGPIHPDMWLVVKTGHSSFNGLGGNSVTPVDTYIPYHLIERQPSEVTQLMDRAGVNVMLVQTTTVPKIVDASAWRTVSTVGNLTIVKRKGPNRLSVDPQGSSTSLAVTKWANESIDWRVAGGSGPVILALPAFPKWSIHIDGKGVPLRQQDGYVILDVPAGAQQITARYHRSLGDRVGVLLSIVALAGIAWTFAGEDWRRRLRRQPAAPTPRAPDGAFDPQPEPPAGDPILPGGAPPTFDPVPAPPQPTFDPTREAPAPPRFDLPDRSGFGDPPEA